MMSLPILWLRQPIKSWGVRQGSAKTSDVLYFDLSPTSMTFASHNENLSLRSCTDIVSICILLPDQCLNVNLCLTEGSMLCDTLLLGISKIETTSGIKAR